MPKKKAKTLSPATEQVQRSYEYSQAIQVFAFHMLGELMANEEKKGNFLKWFPDYDQALSELKHHVKKLTNAIYHGDNKLITEYCADLSNVCLAIHRSLGVVEPPAPERKVPCPRRR